MYHVNDHVWQILFVNVANAYDIINWHEQGLYFISNAFNLFNVTSQIKVQGESLLFKRLDKIWTKSNS